MEGIDMITKGRSTGISLGRFRIDKKYIDNFLDDENIEMLFQIMKDVIVLKIEKQMLTFDYEYTGISKHFDSINEGDKIPLYKIQMTKNIMGNKNEYSVSFKKESEVK